MGICWGKGHILSTLEISPDPSDRNETSILVGVITEVIGKRSAARIYKDRIGQLLVHY
jgi:hypothetical protein